MMCFAKKYQVHSLKSGLDSQNQVVFIKQAPAQKEDLLQLNITDLPEVATQCFLTVLHSSEYMHERGKYLHLINEYGMHWASRKLLDAFWNALKYGQLCRSPQERWSDWSH